MPIAFKNMSIVIVVYLMYQTTELQAKNEVELLNKHHAPTIWTFYLYRLEKHYFGASLKNDFIQKIALRSSYIFCNSFHPL